MCEGCKLRVSIGPHLSRARRETLTPEALALYVPVTGVAVTELVDWRTLALAAFQTATGERTPVEAMVDRRKP
jgi:hypothetical protein